jgi:hypothetical protein
MDKRYIEDLIEELPVMDRPRMAQLWEEYLGHAPALNLRIDMMRPILVFRIQERQNSANSRRKVFPWSSWKSTGTRPKYLQAARH